MKTSLPEELIFYIYVYLDPRKPGRFTYGDFITFFYEPYYVGKGNGDRLYDHLYHDKQAKKNKYRYSKIQKIRKENNEPRDFIIKNINNISEKCSLCFEKFLICFIGRNDLYNGPLTNFTDGGDGISGYKHKEETLIKLRKTLIGRKVWSSGIKFNDEHKKNISEGHKGIKQSKEQILKRYNTNIKNGGYKKNYTEDVKKKMRNNRKDTKYISKILDDGVIVKLVKVYDIDSYLKDGWILGRKNKRNKEWVSKNTLSRKNNGKPWHTKETIDKITKSKSK
jgi:hypothetical protein